MAAHVWTGSHPCQLDSPRPPQCHEWLLSLWQQRVRFLTPPETVAPHTHRCEHRSSHPFHHLTPHPPVLTPFLTPLPSSHPTPTNVSVVLHTPAIVSPHTHRC
eukprot:365801-Chlamydomonas_euryale.AAC.9